MRQGRCKTCVLVKNSTCLWRGVGAAGLRLRQPARGGAIAAWLASAETTRLEAAPLRPPPPQQVGNCGRGGASQRGGQQGVQRLACDGARHRDATHDGAVDAPAGELVEREETPHGLRLHPRLNHAADVNPLGRVCNRAVPRGGGHPALHNKPQRRRYRPRHHDLRLRRVVPHPPGEDHREEPPAS